MSRMPLSLIFILLLTDPVYHEESSRFRYPINNIAVGRKYVTVATENCLHQFNHTLNRIKTTGPHGGNDTVCMGEKVSSNKPTYYNKILLAYNDTVLTCWNEAKGSCIELHMSNLTAMGKAEEGIVPQDPNHGARGLIFFKEKGINLLVAQFTTSGKGADHVNTIVLRPKIKGEFVFSRGYSVSLKKDTPGLNYVDAFQWKNKFIFPYYPAVGSSARVVVLTENNVDLEFYAQSHLKCGIEPQRNIVLASFGFHSSEGFLWAGIFSTNSTTSTDRTALCLYNFTLLAEHNSTCVHEDFSLNPEDCTNSTDLVPLYKNPILTHGDLTAVHIKEVERRLVFFLGTENGKLLKFSLKPNYDASCPEVLYAFKDEAPVFEKIHMDPVDIDYLYVATVKEIKRLKIANCEQHESCNDCLSAYDPHCGWCQSKSRCTMKTECEASTALGKWIGFSEGYGKCLKIKVLPKDGKISVIIEKNPLLFDEYALWNCKVINKDKSEETLCTSKNDAPSLNCSCQISADKASPTATLTAEAQSKNLATSAQFQFQKCSQYSEFRCLDCITNGCVWCTNTSSCTSPKIQCRNEDYADEDKCRMIEEKATHRLSPNITITYVAVDRVSSAGMKDIFISGENLQDLPRVLLFGASSCKPQVLKVFNKHSTHALISLPQSENEVKKLCVDFSGNCYTNGITYESVSCSAIVPNTVWLSGGRNLSMYGKNLDFIENIIISRDVHQKNANKYLGNSTYCHFQAPNLGEKPQTYNVNLRIQDSPTICGELIYKDDPIFKTFHLLNDNNNEIELLIEKTKDDLGIQPHEIDIQIHYKDVKLSCKAWNVTVIKQNSIQCKAKNIFKERIDAHQMLIKINLGNFNVDLKPEEQNTAPYYFILLVVPLLVIVVIAAYLITRHKSKELSKKLSRDLVELECEIRKEIREGFAELQTDKDVVTMEALGTIPFFDYKHFALNTFFPESDKNRQDLWEKLCENIPSPFQTRRSSQDEEIVKTLKTLFENQNFLALLIHTLEKQNDFTIKDRCMFASFLTINFQSNLLYLTGLLERLTKDLIEQSSNKHPKLMLRRTETVVEKLLTNWMSTCLYGFLRESVGEPLYNLVHTLNQRIHKGPIDAVTCKALYTLNEDWLLWQITEFRSVEINVQFPKPAEHEDEDNSQCIKVTVLDCDTIGQVKEKVLQSFQIEKGYSFGHPLSDIVLELHHGQTFKELLDIDSSNVMNENNIINLNTIKHYQIDNGATIKLHVKKNGHLPDTEYSKDQYCHLEMPESEENEPQNPENKGKHKFKVKEIYLTKLLSTKVAVHSAVEKLFKSIWTVPHNKPPIAIKYFFDFLDTQTEIKKITDPDVVHIWKTNSLPLRFWINLLKNPQFVLDIKKSVLLDICLSVIAQAFMDGFSLTEHQLGKSAPTNKLLYAKDIPLFKEAVKAYYKEIRDAPKLSSTELTDFLISESKKHDHEFKEDVALKELFKYIGKYFDVIISTLEKETGFDSELRQLQQLKDTLADKKKCVWE